MVLKLHGKTAVFRQIVRHFTQTTREDCCIQANCPALLLLVRPPIKEGFTQYKRPANTEIAPTVLQFFAVSPPVFSVFFLIGLAVLSTGGVFPH